MMLTAMQLLCAAGACFRHVVCEQCLLLHVPATAAAAGQPARLPHLHRLPHPLTPPRAFKPDIIHCSSPGIMWLAALIYSRLLKAPLVYSYHTHVPEYMPRWVCGTLNSVCSELLRWCRPAYSYRAHGACAPAAVRT